MARPLRAVMEVKKCQHDAVRQVFRTEHHSKRLGPSASLSLMAVVLLTIMSLAAVAALVTHPSQAADLALHPGLLGKALGRLSLQQLLPIFWTGLCSTDAVLLIEVRSLSSCHHLQGPAVYLSALSEPALTFIFHWLTSNL